jgi:copper(I)-binding protein
MQPAKEIIVAGHSSLELEKAGYHFMLMSPKTPIKRGDRIPITLTFSDGSSVTARFDVK